VSHLALQPGTVIDGYEVVALLGRGGMGAVYRVRRGSSELALKTIAFSGNAELASEEAARFRREGELLATLGHPGIVRVHAAGAKPGFLYFVMQLVEGEPLDARLKREGALRPQEAVRIVLEIADAIVHAHARGVVHRDLKPENILLEDGTRPLVTDFGLARRLGEENAERLTRTGEVLGTPAFLAPEQAFGLKEELDEKTDIYGLGVLLYTMLSGSAPFDGPSALVIMKKVSTEDPPPLKGVPPELEAFVLRAMAKSRGKRPPSARAFAEELRKIPLDDSASISRATWLLLGLALTSVVVLGTVLWTRTRASSGKTSSIAGESTAAPLVSSIPTRKASPYKDALDLATLESRIACLEQLRNEKVPLPEDKELRRRIAAAWLARAAELDKELRDLMKSGSVSFGIDRQESRAANPQSVKSKAVIQAFSEYCAVDPSPDLMADDVKFTLTMIQMLSRNERYSGLRGERWTEFWCSVFARCPDHPTIRFVRACEEMNAHPLNAPPSREALREAHEARLFFEKTTARPHTRVLAHNFVIDVLRLRETPQGDLGALMAHARYRDETNQFELGLLAKLKFETEPIPDEILKPEVFLGWERR